MANFLIALSNDRVVEKYVNERIIPDLRQTEREAKLENGVMSG